MSESKFDACSHLVRTDINVAGSGSIFVKFNLVQNAAISLHKGNYSTDYSARKVNEEFVRSGQTYQIKNDLSLIISVHSIFQNQETKY